MEETYFDKTVPQTLEQVKATANGLTAQEAARRLEEHGPNQLAEGKKEKPAGGISGAVQGSAGLYSGRGGSDLHGVR